MKDLIWQFQQPSWYSETVQGTVLHGYFYKDWGSLHWWWTLWQCHPIHTWKPHLSLSSSNQLQVYLKHPEKSNKERQNCLFPKNYCRRKRTSSWDEHPSHFHETRPSKISMDVLSQDARVQVGWVWTTWVVTNVQHVTLSSRGRHLCAMTLLSAPPRKTILVATAHCNFLCKVAFLIWN